MASNEHNKLPSFRFQHLKNLIAKMKRSKDKPAEQKEKEAETDPPIDQTDGPWDSQFLGITNSKKRKGGDVAAIFVHAGAGFHSHQNENVHLEACAKACQAGMEFLKAGGSAVDAAEAAVRILEDNEITNAGFGSNLTINGVVECDATIVDHFGRSGAVGAMGQVAHPIHVARLILEGSTHRLSLRRVPPNLLVGQGAIDFAWEHSVPIMHPDFLISPAARTRWRRWTRDLEQTEEKAARDNVSEAAVQLEPKPGLMARLGLNMTPNSDKRHAPLANESQPYSPNLSPGPPSDPSTSHESFISGSSPRSFSRPRPPPGHENCEAGSCSKGMPNICPAMVHYASPYGSGLRQDGFSEILITQLDDGTQIDPDPPIHEDTARHPLLRGVPDIYQRASPRSLSNISEQGGLDNVDNRDERDSDFSMGSDEESSGSKDDTAHIPGLGDHITDTVGAIAIDSFGNIAAASSSGGIGMKHRGRTGPAALVGIGSAVHPVHPGDKSKKSVAVVTSGTGEHMATTMAAGACANRLYWGTKSSSTGNIAPADDEEAIQSFLLEDFMGHPSVKYSNTSAAIGVMAVKKTADGVYFHFAHNTDSFALCSFTSEDAEPVVVMSRMPNKTNKINTGARSCGYRPPRNEYKEPKRRKTKPSSLLSKKEDKGTRSSSPRSFKTSSAGTEYHSVKDPIDARDI